MRHTKLDAPLSVCHCEERSDVAISTPRPSCVAVRRFGIWHGLLLLPLLVVTGCRGVGLREMKSAVEQAAGDSSRIATFYANRDFAPYWTQKPGLSDEAIDVLNRLCRADDEGLDASAFDLLTLADLLETAYDEALPDSQRARATAQLEVGLSDALVRFADQMHHGVTDPRTLGAQWHVNHDTLMAYEVLQQTTTDGIDALLDELSAPRPAYAELRRAHARYRAIAARGGWKSVPSPESPNFAHLLTARLFATHDLPDDADSTSASPTDLAEGVRHFQQRHGLLQTGRVDVETRGRLNVSAEDRARTLGRNLERARWMPAQPGPRYLYANLASGIVQGFDEGNDPVRLSATSTRDTPLRADTLRTLTMAPTWNVPPAKAADLMRRGLLTENAGFEAYQSEQRVPMSGVTEDELARGTVRVKQRGGGRNALGSLALRPRLGGAAFVHGGDDDDVTPAGVDVEDAASLAAFVLDWTSERAAAALRAARAEETARVLDIEPALPYFALYLTAWAEPDGTVHFRPDVRGRDAALDSALRAAVAPVDARQLSDACTLLTTPPATDD